MVLTPFNGCMLSHEPGLGKTLTSSCIMQAAKYHITSEKHVRKPCLVVCPRNLLVRWATSELPKFFDREYLSFCTYHKYSLGNEEKKTLNQYDKNVKHLERFDVILTTYNTIQSEMKYLLRHYETVHQHAFADATILPLVQKHILKKGARNDVPMSKSGLQPPDVKLLSIDFFTTICNKAYTLRGQQSLMFVAVNNIRTRKRVLLTGSPFSL